MNDWVSIGSISGRGLLVIMFLVAVVITTWNARQRRQAIQTFRRGCAGRAWRNAFPDVTAEQVRTFLNVFADAFDLGRSMVLQMRPEDRPIDLHRAIYARTFGPDSLELVSFMLAVERKYGVKSRQILWEEVTLAEVFAAAMKNLPPRLPRRWE